ncbi:alpha/beta fold hydrolase [Candidatus Mycosynbacter amalyticus]|uniref:Alpha/beta fold hydrolase n=1 Tax=Candidatus Mycosynbacter amalyticus TaxID=2665156 RepID=A0A857MJY8_9BACT|nr:alpha/beta hydrolase [Candidatus Mycosynbacter amalyticus]QHN42894.1 alpha/beta fold hydrolase [Candidatus Mycosynbacter amalyticus]
MATRWVLLGIVVLLVLLLWQIGRHVRACWWVRPVVVEDILSQNPDADRDIVFLDGAFNLASEHADDIMSRLSQWGTVLYVDYDFDSYNHEAVYRAFRDKVKASAVRDVCFFGGSMGAINALRLAATLREKFDRVVVFGADAALCNEVLPAGQRQLAQVVRFLHPGPVFNWPGKLFIRLALRGIPNSHLDEPGNLKLEKRVRSHINAMRRYTLNAFLEMTDTIARAPLPSAAKLEGIESVYLQSGSDKTIRGNVARDIWLGLFPDATVVEIPEGEHLTFQEHKSAWGSAVDRECGRLFG